MEPNTDPNQSTNLPASSPPTPPATKPPDSSQPSGASKLPNQDKLRWLKAHRKVIAMVAAGVIVVGGIGGVLAYKHFHHPKKVAVTKTVAAPIVPPKPIVSPLTGLPVTAAVAAQPVFGVVIENSPEARPQSGLSQAGVVYEALAEGGITRHLAVFQDQQPTKLGPVRSLRPYFIDWIQEYNNAPIAHAGGSSMAIAEVPQLNVKSMNGLNYGSSFTRASDRFAPHNLYTTSAALLALAQRLNYTTAPSFTPWPRQADTPEATPTHPTITITYSYALFTARYNFEAASDSYLRVLAGAPAIDRNSGAQIKVKNVVAIYMPTTYDSAGHALMTTIGTGKAIVFRDGGATVGTWKKTARTSRIEFLDAAGAPIPLNAGNTWVSVIPPTGSVAY